MIPYHGQRYFATTETVNDVLKQYGVAIIPSLLSSKECDKMLSDMWNYLETVTASFERPINRDDTQTWREFKKLFPLHSMLVQHWQIGHSKLVWRLRQNPKIYNVFAAIYDVEPEELLVSFDGASFHFPPEITGVGFRQKENSGWLHCDQSYLRNRRECVQAWVTANDVEKDDATLVFLEGSHKFHQKFAATFPPRDKEYNQDWYRLSERQVAWYIEQRCTPVCIRCPKGSLVLFESRLIHAGTESKRNRANPKIRCVAYICFMPRGDISETMLKKKRKAFEEMRTTNHWPCKPRLFPKTPRTYGAPLPAIEKIEMPEVGELGLKFAGF